MRIFGSIQPKSEISPLLHTQLISAIMLKVRTYSAQITNIFRFHKIYIGCMGSWTTWNLYYFEVNIYLG